MKNLRALREKRLGQDKTTQASSSSFLKPNNEPRTLNLTISTEPISNGERWWKRAFSTSYPNGDDSLELLYIFYFYFD